MPHLCPYRTVREPRPCQWVRWAHQPANCKGKVLCFTVQYGFLSLSCIIAQLVSWNYPSPSQSSAAARWDCRGFEVVSASFAGFLNWNRFFAICQMHHFHATMMRKEGIVLSRSTMCVVGAGTCVPLTTAPSEYFVIVAHIVHVYTQFRISYSSWCHPRSPRQVAYREHFQVAFLELPVLGIHSLG